MNLVYALLEDYLHQKVLKPTILYLFNKCIEENPYFKLLIVRDVSKKSLQNLSESLEQKDRVTFFREYTK